MTKKQIMVPALSTKELICLLAVLHEAKEAHKKLGNDKWAETIGNLIERYKQH